MQAPVVSPEAEVLVRLEAQAACVALPRGQWRLLGFGVASGVLLWLCHFPVAWSWFGSGFSWYLLGHSQHNALPLIQIADLAGVFAVGTLLLVVNVVIFEGLCRLAPARQLLGVPPAPPGQCCGWYAAQVALALLLV